MRQPGTVAPVAGSAPRLIGIVNITEDSFSDGGRYLAPADAVAHALKLRADGAEFGRRDALTVLGALAFSPGP